MAIGDAVANLESKANNAYLDVQPGASIEWIIHNIYAPDGSAIELYRYDGSNEILIDSFAGSWFSFYWHCTNGHYLRIKNVSGATIYVGYDGVVSG